MKRNEMRATALFDPRFLAFYQPLHEKFVSWQQKLADKRKFVNDRLKEHTLPGRRPKKVDYTSKCDWSENGHYRKLLPEHPEVPKNFDIQIPLWCSDQRNQMTGPADDAALVVKMLNSGAPGVMIDLEDSQANYWDNTVKAYENLQKLFKGELSYIKNGQEIKVNTDVPTVLWIRPRGLHMSQLLRFPMTLTTVETSATLLDVAMAAYNFGRVDYKLPCKDQSLCFYIPKTEHAEEAKWWNELFKDIAEARGWPKNFIKCMALVESHSLAYQAKEFVWLLQDHLVGLNLGRWDYMASLIEQNFNDPNWVLPDRNTIPHDVTFFQNLRKHLVNTCHKHGILAIGGMTALYPSREDVELNERALKVLEADKKNEAEMGMDGAWTGHPDQNQIAVDQFPQPNQLEFIHDGLPEEIDLRPPLEGGEITIEGTRTCVRVAIRYRNGVLNGKGASLLDGYMEDLATDRICRLMIAQRWRHLPDHTDELIQSLFDEELDRLLREGKEVGTEETLRKARVLTEQYIFNGTHTPE